MLRLVVVLGWALALVGACSNGPASPAPAAPGGSVAPSVSAATTASPSPSPSAAASSSAGSGDDLTAYLPGSVGGVQLTRSQFGGDDFTASGAVSTQMQALLTGLGRGPKDLTMAIASDPTSKSDLSITAFRVRDVPVDAFLQGYLPMLRQAYGDASVAAATRDGRPVYTVAAQPGAPPQVLVPHGDVLFVVLGSNAALVDEAIELLP